MNTNSTRAYQTEPSPIREPTLTERLQENLNSLNSIQDDAQARLSGLYGRMFGHPPAESVKDPRLSAVATATAAELTDTLQSAISRANTILALICDLSREL